MGKKILDSKLLYAFLAIIIAIALWFYVAAVENRDETKESTISGIPITFTNVEVLEESNLMISQGAIQNATLTVSGPRSMLVKLTQEKEKISLTIDVSKITSPGQQRMAYTVKLPSGYESSVSVTNRYPNNIDFVVSRRIDREIEVKGKFNGTLANGYMLGDFEIIPGKIGVTGLESEVNRIDYALVTVTGEGLRTTVKRDLGFELIDFQGNVLTDLDVTLAVETVAVTMPVIKTADVPLAVKWVTGGGISAWDIQKYVDCKIEPEIITVSGAEMDLRPLREIVLGEIELGNIIGSDTFEFDIPLDPALENISGVTKATVTVTIRDLETKILDVDNIELMVADGMEAQSVTKSLQVLVRGPKEALELVLSHNLRAVADLSLIDTGSGRYNVPVKIYLAGTTNVGVVGDDYKIVVDISK